MEKFFVPYSHGYPVAVEIKGHRLLLVSKDRRTMLADLESIGGDMLREFVLPEGSQAELAELAASVRGGIVVAPEGMTLGALQVNLETELPWVH